MSTRAVRNRMATRDKIDVELTERLTPHGFVRRTNRPHSTDVLFSQPDTETTVSIDFEIYLSVSVPAEGFDDTQTIYLGYIEEEMRDDTARTLAYIATALHEATQRRRDAEGSEPDDEDPGARQFCSGS